MAKKTRGSWVPNGLVVTSVCWVLIHADIEVTVQGGEDAILPCGTQRQPFLNYTQITWYKVSKNMETMNVITRKNLRNGAIFPEDDQELVQVLNDTCWSLRIRNTTPTHSGVYCCYLRAPLGEINRKTTIELKVTAQDTQSDQDKNSTYRNTEMLVIFLLVVSLLLLFLNYLCNRIQNIFPKKAKHGLNHVLPLFTAQEMKNLQYRNKLLQNTNLI
ncbi:CD83 antigen [Lissotriton helveticus]